MTKRHTSPAHWPATTSFQPHHGAIEDPVPRPRAWSQGRRSAHHHSLRGPAQAPGVAAGHGGAGRLAQADGAVPPASLLWAAGWGLLAGGVAVGAWGVERFVQVRQIATGSAMAAMLLFITGLVLLSTGFTLHSIRGLLHDMLDGHIRPHRK